MADWSEDEVEDLETARPQWAGTFCGMGRFDFPPGGRYLENGDSSATICAKIFGVPAMTSPLYR